MRLKDLDKPDNAGCEGVCEHCEEAMGTMTINPYDEDIKGIERWEFICAPCFNMLCNEI